MMKVIESRKFNYTLDEAQEALDYLSNLRSRDPLFILSGELGSGKTTLVRLLLQHWGVRSLVTSPTYAYLNKYQEKSGAPIYHLDLYRMRSADDFIEYGFQEYLEQRQGLVFIEWPDVIASLLRGTVCSLMLEHSTSDEREVRVDLIEYDERG